MGAWVTYGIGSESADLPGFVVLQSGPRGPRGGALNWGSGFLPSAYQGVPLAERRRADLEPEHAGGNLAERSSDGRSTPWSRSTRLTLTSRPTRRSPRGSPPTRSPRGCRPVAPELIDLASETPETLEAVRGQFPASRRLPTTVCWPGGWSSAAFASFSSITPTGTTTAFRARP